MTYRVYFNREREYPQCWSVDQGDQAREINVCAVRLDGCTAVSRVLSVEERELKRLHADRHPFAWLEVDGYMTVDDGVAVFSAFPPGF